MSYTSIDTISITDKSFNMIWYTGNINNDVFSNSNAIYSFSNSGVILGGGGGGNLPGKMD